MLKKARLDLCPRKQAQRDRDCVPGAYGLMSRWFDGVKSLRTIKCIDEPCVTRIADAPGAAGLRSLMLSAEVSAA